MSHVYQDVAADIGVLWKYEGNKFERVIPIIHEQLEHWTKYRRGLEVGSAPYHYAEEYIDILTGMIPIFTLKETR
jgi:hypothetical protein